MPSPSNDPGRSQPRQNQPPHSHRQNATVRAPEVAVEQPHAAAARLAAVMAIFGPHPFGGSVGAAAAALMAVSAAAGGHPATARAIARHIPDENDRNPRLWARRRGPEDGIPNPPPPYTALPTTGEVTVDLSLPEPEYTPRYTRHAQGQKRKREEGDNLEEDDEEETNSN